MRLFISRKADVAALNRGVNHPCEVMVFDDSDLDERKRVTLTLDPSSRLLANGDGTYSLQYCGDTIAIEPRADDFGYELFFSTSYRGAEAVRRFIDQMKPLPRQVMAAA